MQLFNNNIRAASSPDHRRSMPQLSPLGRLNVTRVTSEKPEKKIAATSDRDSPTSLKDVKFRKSNTVVPARRRMESLPDVLAENQ